MSVPLLPANEPIATNRGPRAVSLSGVAWALYEGCRDPYIGLVAGWVFMPYFTRYVVGDPVRGQSLVASIGLYAGLAAALTAPLLGSTIDGLGPRKPLLVAFSLFLAPLICALWFAIPGGHGLSVAQVATIIGVNVLLLSYAEVLHNSMLPTVAPPQERALASGLALSFGNVANLTLALFLLWGLMLPGTVHWPLIPSAPLFGLDRAKHQPERLVGPLVGVLMLLGTASVTLFSRDAVRTGATALQAGRAGVAALSKVLRNPHLHRDPIVYLVARTVSLDAGSTFFLLGGVYASGVMRWGTTELLVYGILGSIAGILGGLAAAFMDTRFGPKTALKVELALSAIGLLGEITTSPDRIFGVSLGKALIEATLWNGPMFRTPSDLAFVACAFLIFMFQTGAWASNRTLLTRLAPKDQVGAFFGLAALSGSATVWLGPLLAGVCTQLFKAQQAGFVPILVLFLVGLGLLFFVRGGGRENAFAESEAARPYE